MYNDNMTHTEQIDQSIEVLREALIRAEKHQFPSLDKTRAMIALSVIEAYFERGIPTHADL